MTGTAPILRAFLLPKAGEPIASCRDAYDYRLPHPGTEGPIKVAVSDGATTATASGTWARILVEAAVEGMVAWKHPTYRRRFLRLLRRRWKLEAEQDHPRPLPWFALAALERGAFATLLRVVVRPGRWYVEGWGDTCFFHLRGDRCVRMVPDLSMEAFTADPYLLASREGHDQDLKDRMFDAQGRITGGDRLVLATDALACWLLGQMAQGRLGSWLPELDDQDAFKAWIQELRTGRGLRNDDVALVIVDFP